MNKTLLYLLAAIVLGGAAWWTIQQNQKKSTINKLDLNFAVPDTGSINKIVIEQRPGTDVTLERQADGFWTMNKTDKAAPQLMELLLATIRNVEMQRPVEPNEAITIENDLKKRYRKVDIYVKGELYKSYFVGDDAPGYKGTYFKFADGQPYVCHLRGFNGFLTPRYNVVLHEWKDKLLFSSSPQTIQSVEVKYFKTPTDNFKISFASKHFSVEGATTFDTLAAAEYLLRFRKVYLERYLKDFGKRTSDSILAKNPEWSIDFQDIDEARSHVINIYPIDDQERALGYMVKTKEWFTIQSRNLLPLQVRRRDIMGNFAKR